MAQQAHQAPGRYNYTLDMITRNAPPMSGVYMLFSHGTCVYVGESDDVCAGLLEAYYEDNPCLNDKDITHFRIDLVPRESRQAQQLDRIREFRPGCNLRKSSAHCDQCALAKRFDPGLLQSIGGAPGR